MQITWRDKPYTFQPKVIWGGVDTYSHHSTIDAPIFGADTESVDMGDRYEPQCFTISSKDGDRIVWLPEKDDALYYFLEDFIYEYVDGLFENEQRHALLYYHNLEYDWLQLVKRNPLLLELARVGVGKQSDMHLFTIKGYKIILRGNALFSGSAPHFRLKIQRSKDEWFNLHWRDTFSFFPSTLAKAMTDLKLGVDKMERQEDIGRVDYRNIKDSDPRKIEFSDYAKIDARGTRLLGENIRDLHRDAGMTKIRVSAPAYAINLLYHTMNDLHTEDRPCGIRTGVDDPSIMQLIFDTYRGGRTGGLKMGYVENIDIFDIHSSYPSSMATLPSFHPNMQYVRVDDLSITNVLDLIQEVPAFLRVSGYESDNKYPALITTHNGLLTPVYGSFSNIATTGVELCVGIKSGSLLITEVHEMIVLIEMEDEPILPIKLFVEGLYEEKKAAVKGSVTYTRTKLGLNSPYGKLIESQEQTFVGARDGRIMLPYIEGMEKECSVYYYEKYLELFETGSTFWDNYDEVVGELLDAFDEETVAGMKHQLFSEFSLSGRVYGRFVVPAAASLITATSRARLLATIKALDSFYWDTDSAFGFHLDDDEVNRRLQLANTWLPENIQPLRIGDELGDLGLDIANASGYLAGTKRYYVENGDEKKSATHGIPALNRADAKAAIKALALGDQLVFDDKKKKDIIGFEYESKPKPTKAKEAKSVAEIGLFKSKVYRPKFHLDNRLTWIKHDTGFEGVLREFESIQETKKNPAHEQILLDLLDKK